MDPIWFILHPVQMIVPISDAYRPKGKGNVKYDLVQNKKKRKIF